MKIKLSSLIIVLVLIGVGIPAYVLYNTYGTVGMYSEGRSMASGSFGDSIYSSLHWHPKLLIRINGEEQYIPKGIGIIIGNVIDTDVSGMQMSPMHTHEDDGTIHMEQQNPNSRTVRLGYFFEVWDKRFDSECIFEYCNSDGKTVKMFVNGKPNFEFDDYIPRDGDNIQIVYD